MKDFFKSMLTIPELAGIITPKQVSERRKITKSNLAKHLKETFFFTDEEVKAVTDVIDYYYRKMDTLQKTKDYSNYGLLSSQKMEMELLKVQKAMITDVKDKMKSIMAAKVAKAKKHFKKE